MGLAKVFLTHVVLLLARSGKPEVSNRALPRVSQQLLAEMVGTTRSRVNSFLDKFRKLGFIDYEHSGALTISEALLSVIRANEATSLSDL